jgi:lipid-binding SYLF domain-containing protein
MKQAAIILLFGIAVLSGCAKHQQTKVVPQPPSVEAQKQPMSAPVRAASSSPQYLARLQDYGSKLEELVADTGNAVPDSVLNRSACFVMFSATSGSSNVANGFATCRNQSGWTSPVVVNANRISGVQQGTDVLLLLVGERAVEQLQRGVLTVGPLLRTWAGPMERTTPTVSDDELHDKNIFCYERDGKRLSAASLKTAVIETNVSLTQELYGHKFNPAWLLARSTYSSTTTSFLVTDVGSFFNAITPIGIIIHHSVLIPASALPDAERALDRFHYARGFAISCFGHTYHIAYHYLILPNGAIQQGRPERCEGAHARGYNSYLGIALVGDFSSQDNPSGRKGPITPTPEQMRSLVKLCRQLRQKYNIPLQRIMPHSEVSRTHCPGDRFAFKTVLAQLELQSTSGE